MDAKTPKREGLLADYLSEADLAAELKRDPRTVQRWRKLRIGPPYVMNGIAPMYSIEQARAWLAAGGTAGVRKGAKRGSTPRGRRGAHGSRQTIVDS